MAEKKALRSGDVLLAAGVVLVAGAVFWYLAGGMMRRTPSHGTRCAANLKHLVMAIVAYQMETEGEHLPVVLDADQRVRDAREASQVTNRSLELLAARMQLPNPLFRCAAAKRPAPQTRPLAPGGAWIGNTSYAYDWAAPSESASWRIILADRSLANHRRAVLAAAADTSVRTFKPTGVDASGRRTQDADGNPVTAVVPNVDAGSDTLFDDLGDDEGGRYDGLIPGRGSPGRAWVK